MRGRAPYPPCMYRYGMGLALVALLAAGCSDDKAGGLPPLSSAPSTPVVTTATPTATATTAQTPAQQVEVAARAYFAALESAGQTGDVSTLEPLLAPKCDCRRALAAIEADAKAGRHVTTRYVVSEVKAGEVTATAGTAVVTFSSPASKLVDANGKTVRSLPARKDTGAELTFRLAGSKWLLEQVVLLGA